MKNEKVRSISELKSQRLSVGILASRWIDFKQTLEILAQHQLHLLHFDIADGQFSPLFTVGAIGVKQFSAPFIKDVHLMVKNPFLTARECVEAGADILTLQIESDEDLNPIYDWIRDHSPTTLCGISLCPNTDLNLIFPYLDKVDVIQILTLDPRIGIKAEQADLIKRIQQLSEQLGEQRQHKIISVDGSMNLNLAKLLVPLDIDWIVSGSALFAGEQLHDTLSRWTTALA